MKAVIYQLLLLRVQFVNSGITFSIEYSFSHIKKLRILRSSRPVVFCKKAVPRNFAKFTGKHLCQILFFNKVADIGLQLY